MSFRSEENGTSLTRGRRVSSASVCTPAFRAATSSAPFGRVSVHDPPAIARLDDGVVRAIRDTERAFQFDLRAPRRWVRRRRVPPRRPGAYPAPANVTRPLAVTTTRTVISFLVSVPVLSEAMTLAEPSVSTAARCRTIAFRRAIRCTPIASTAVTTAGSPSGTAATASATPRMSTSRTGGQAANVLDNDDRRDHHDGDGDDDQSRGVLPVRSSSR